MRVDDLDVGELVPGSACRQCTTSSSTSPVIAELVIEQQVVVAVDGAADRVLERHHAVRGALLDDRFEHLVERLARQRLGLRSAEMQRGRFAVGARFSLIRKSHN